MKRNAEKGVLILECIDHSDPGSEGRFLSHMFNLMKVKSQYVEVRTRKQLLSLMGCSPYNYIHITTHGVVSEKFVGWWTPDSEVDKANLKSLEGKLTGKTLVSTACRSGEKAFCKYIVHKLGCKFCLAPKGKPKFHNSIMFAHIFYHKLFVQNLGVMESYKAYNKKYTNPHCFTIYKRKNRPNKVLRAG